MLVDDSKESAVKDGVRMIARKTATYDDIYRRLSLSFHFQLMS